MNNLSLGELNLLINGIGVWGVSVKGLPGGKTVLALNENELFPTASVIKLPILIGLYYQAIEGNIDLYANYRITKEFRTGGSGILSRLSERVTMTLKDLAIMMMQLSDNTASNLLISLVGKETINQTLTSIGLTHTMLHMDRVDPELVGHSPEALATTTPNDMSLLLTHLASEDILTPTACREILGIMKRNTNKQRLCGQLPFRPDLVIHHKTGTLPGVYNDVGLIRFAKGQYVISVLTKNMPRFEDPRTSNPVEQTIAQISRWVFEQLSTPERDISVRPHTTQV